MSSTHNHEPALAPAHKLARILRAALLTASLIVLTSSMLPAGAALANDAPSVTVSPSSIPAGAVAEVAASGLGGLQSVGFGLDDNAAGTFAGGGTSVTVDVEAGIARASFTAGHAGTFVIDISDGETPLAQATITVTAAPAPSPTTPAPSLATSSTPEPTPSATPSSPATSLTPVPPSEPDDGAGLGWPWAVVIIAALVAAVIITLVLARRLRTTDTNHHGTGSA